MLNNWISRPSCVLCAKSEMPPYWGNRKVVYYHDLEITDQPAPAFETERKVVHRLGIAHGAVLFRPREFREHIYICVNVIGFYEEHIKIPDDFGICFRDR